VVLDTSVVVAALRSDAGASALWLDAALRGRYVIVLSAPLTLEYEAVLKRPDMLSASGLSDRQVDEILDALVAVSDHVALVYRRIPVLPDRGDEMVLETAIAGRADILLTFNIKDFATSHDHGIQVLRPGEAVSRLKGAPE
jgi:putative PIN family toxin of toxin-antitoxin system